MKKYFVFYLLSVFVSSPAAHAVMQHLVENEAVQTDI